MFVHHIYRAKPPQLIYSIVSPAGWPHPNRVIGHVSTSIIRPEILMHDRGLVVAVAVYFSGLFCGIDNTARSHMLVLCVIDDKNHLIYGKCDDGAQ